MKTRLMGPETRESCREGRKNDSPPFEKPMARVWAGRLARAGGKNLRPADSAAETATDLAEPRFEQLGVGE